MLDKEIEKLRKELNDAIAEKRDYSEIYRLSIEMDELIDFKNGVIKMTDDCIIAKSKEELKV